MTYYDQGVRSAAFWLSLIAMSALLACSEPEPQLRTIYAELKLDNHSGLSSNGSFTIEMDPPFEESDQQAARRITIAQELQLWDFDSETLVPCQASLVGSLYSMGNPVQFRITTQTLKNGHDFGFRSDDRSIKGRYTGIGGEFEQLSKNGELGVFHVGSRLRVWEIGFKGSAIYLAFSEPVAAATINGAITLINTKTGRSLAMTQSSISSPSAELTLYVNETIDITAEHKFNISKSVTTAAGSPLDGSFSGVSSTGTDFALTLTAAQTETFVNGPSRKVFLQMTCNHNIEWWNSETGAPEQQRDGCRVLE